MKAMKFRAAEKRSKNTARLFIEGEWISVDYATDDSGAEISAIGRRIVTPWQCTAKTRG